MKITCVGGGPAGLFFAILMKSADENHDITLFERNPAGQTYGWGVVYWDDLIEKLYANDPETAHAIRANSFRWADQIVHIKDRQAIHPGGHGFSISRQRLIGILAARAAALGVRVEFGSEIGNLAPLAGAELIVASDGVGSRVRELYAGKFGTSITAGRNKYIWLGTRKRLMRSCLRSSKRAPGGSGFTHMVSTTRRVHVSSSAPRKRGRNLASTGAPRLRASHSWSGFSSSASTATG